jgi:ABC-type multidrug transport system fused ATPase/permease subunit
MNKQAILVKKVIRLWQRGNTIKLLWQTGSSAIIDGIQLVIYIVIGVGIITGNYTFAYMILLLQLINTVSTYIWNIRRYLKEYYKSIVHIEKLRETFSSIPSIKDSTDKKEFNYKKGDFTLKNISFAYHKNNIFQNFSLNIA